LKTTPKIYKFLSALDILKMKQLSEVKALQIEHPNGVNFDA